MAVLVPVLIVLGCVLVIAAIRFVTRPRPSMADVEVPTLPAAEPSAPADPPTREDLVAWHRVHEPALLAFIEGHDGWLATDRTDRAQATVPSGADLEEAIVSHPDPISRAELGALVAAATSTRALWASEPNVAERHHEAYRDYRHLWSERLWQFRSDATRVLAVTQAEPALTLTPGSADKKSGGMA